MTFCKRPGQETAMDRVEWRHSKMNREESSIVDKDRDQLAISKMVWGIR